MDEVTPVPGLAPDYVPDPVYYYNYYEFGFGGWLWLLAVLLFLLLLIRVWRLGQRTTRLEARLAAALADLPASAGAAPRTAAADPVASASIAPNADDRAEAAADQPRPSSRGLPWPDLDPEAARAAAAMVEPPDQDGPLVFRADRFADLGHWIRTNWVYVISAVSLALAGIYFVQYGIESGLLSPLARVLSALALGAALIVAGEWLRRKQRPDGPTAFLPATFAGAGLVSIYAATVAARQMYGLVGPETAFAGLVATAALAVLLGWFHGPLLTAVGLIGAAVAPFAVGGDSSSADWLYGWYVAIGAVGLAVDAARRWAWISVLALVLAYGGLVLLLGGIGAPGWYALALTALALLTLVLPVWSLTPMQDGPMLLGAVLRLGKGAWPAFPTRLALGTVAVSSLFLTLLPADAVADSWLALLCLAGLGLALILWAADAPALADLTVLPVIGFLIRLVLEVSDRQPLAQQYLSQRIVDRAPESSGPWTVSVLLGLAIALSLSAAWRSGHARRLSAATGGDTDPSLTRHAPAAWAAAAALTAPMAAVALEIFWAPGLVIGAYPWALHVMALAVLMAVLAERFARADGADRRRAAYAVLSCLSLIALALFIIVTKSALTVALGVLLVVAAALDRRFRLPEMGWFIQAGIVVIGYRLVVDPGVLWAYDAALPDLWLAFGGALVGIALAWVVLPAGRPAPRLMLESGFAGAASLFLNVLLFRAFDGFSRSDEHWQISLTALPWLVVALVQLWRMQLGGWLRWIRLAFAAVAALLWAGPMLLALTLFNPLIGGRVAGPWVFDSLALACALPGAVLIAGRAVAPWRWLRLLLAIAGGALLTFYAALEIRRWFRGDDLSVPGVTQAELYAYTVAMMAAAAVLLFRALRTGSRGRRWAAMSLIALTVAKVFLLDAAGLSGLMRVVSFLALGLALAGVAFLNRWAASLEHAPTAEPPPAPDP